MLVYAGAACAAWSAMGLFAFRSPVVRRHHHWPAQPASRDALRIAAACTLCALALAWLQQVDSTEFAVLGWLLQPGMAGVGFTLVLVLVLALTLLIPGAWRLAQRGPEG